MHCPGRKVRRVLPLVLVLHTLSLFSLLLGLLNLRIVMSLILTYTNYFKLLKLEGEGEGEGEGGGEFLKGSHCRMDSYYTMVKYIWGLITISNLLSCTMCKTVL